jgi:hypothetical protein
VNWGLQINNYELQTVNVGLQTNNYKLQTENLGLQIFNTIFYFLIIVTFHPSF